MTPPVFWLVAGPNGSGKTTIVSRPDIRDVMGPVATINPDAIAKTLRETRGLGLDEANLAAVREADSQVDAHIEAGRSLLVETVLSSDKHESRLIRARERGFATAMIFIALRSPEINVERVAIRVTRGGHDVPRDRIIARWERSHHMLERFLPLLDRLFVFDNSSAQGTSRLVATKNRLAVQLLDADALPAVTMALRDAEAGYRHLAVRAAARLLSALVSPLQSEVLIEHAITTLGAENRFLLALHRTIFEHVRENLASLREAGDALATLRRLYGDHPDWAEGYLVAMTEPLDEHQWADEIATLERLVSAARRERDWRPLPLDWLQLPPALETVLRRRGVTTIGAVEQLADHLEAIPGMDAAAAAIIRAELETIRI